MGEVGDFNTGVTGRRLLGPPKQGLLGRHILLTNNNIRDLEKNNEGKILVQTYEILICIFANTKMTSNKNAHTFRHTFFYQPQGWLGNTACSISFPFKWFLNLIGYIFI